jgi:RNA polymerase sigma factor (sigma-70 family)
MIPTPSELAAAHAHLVEWAVRRLRRRLPWVDVDDARGVAGLALVQAAHLYREQPGGAFVPFALQRLTFRLQDALRLGELTRCRRVRRPGGLARWCHQVSIEACRCVVVDHVDQFAQRRIDLADGLRRLPPRERRVVRQLLAGETHEAIAADLGVSVSRIAQLRARAIGRLREEWGVAA